MFSFEVDCIDGTKEVIACIAVEASDSYLFTFCSITKRVFKLMHPVLGNNIVGLLFVGAEATGCQFVLA